MSINQTSASKLLSTLKTQDTSKAIPNNTVHGSCMSVDELREWLRTLPEPTYQEMQDYLWHERD